MYNKLQYSLLDSAEYCWDDIGRFSLGGIGGGQRDGGGVGVFGAGELGNGAGSSGKGGLECP